jgi:hypothetical protein
MEVVSGTRQVGVVGRLADGRDCRGAVCIRRQAAPNLQLGQGLRAAAGQLEEPRHWVWGAWAVPPRNRTSCCRVAPGDLTRGAYLGPLERQTSGQPTARDQAAAGGGLLLAEGWVVDMKLEVVVLPVADVERARDFYGRLAFTPALPPLTTCGSPSSRGGAWAAGLSSA